MAVAAIVMCASVACSSDPESKADAPTSSSTVKKAVAKRVEPRPTVPTTARPAPKPTTPPPTVPVPVTQAVAPPVAPPVIPPPIAPPPTSPPATAPPIIRGVDNPIEVRDAYPVFKDHPYCTVGSAGMANWEATVRDTAGRQVRVAHTQAIGTTRTWPSVNLTSETVIITIKVTARSSPDNYGDCRAEWVSGA